MVNKELIELCHTVIGAVQESNNLDAPILRKLLLHIVPQLLAELDILDRILETVRLPEPVEVQIVDAGPPPDLIKDKKRKRKRRKR